MQRMISLGRRFRRGMVFVVLAVALVAALMPTAASASGNNGRMTYPTYKRSARQNQHYNRNYQPEYKHSDRYDHDRSDYDRRGSDGHDYDHKDYDKHDKYDKHCATSYRVRRGDTLSEIARHYHTTVYKLAKTNGIRNANRILTGQVLCIP